MENEITLKDESVLAIGNTIANSFKGIESTGKSLVTIPKNNLVPDVIEPKTENILTKNENDIDEVDRNQNIIVSLLQNISDGIGNLVNIFTESLSFQKQEEKEQERAERLVADDVPMDVPSDEPGDDRSIFRKAMDKIASIKESATDLLSKEGIVGLLIKGGLIASLIALAKFLEKYGKLVAEALTPIIDGVKRFYNSLSEDIGPLLEEAFSIIKDTFVALSKIVKGIFTLDSEMFLEGITALGSIVKRIAVFLVDATAAIINAIFKAFGYEGDVTQAVKDFIYNVANKIKQAFIDTFNFITDTLPTAIGNFVNDVIDKVKDTIQAIKDFILAPIKAIKDKVGGFFGGVKDFFTGDDEKMKAETMSGEMKGETKEDTLIRMRDNLLLEGPKSDNPRSKANFVKQVRSLNDAIIKEQGLSEDHLKANKMNPVNYAIAHIEGNDERLVSQMTNADRSTVDNDITTGNLETVSTVSDITPRDLGRGKELNQGSTEIASKNSSNVNVVTSKAGDTNTNVANNSYTNIVETTNTSDNSLRNYLSA
jgi:hypothetical protein